MANAQTAAPSGSGSDAAAETTHAAAGSSSSVGKSQLKLVATLTGHQDKAWHVAWSPKEATLASCSSDKNVKLHKYIFQPKPPSLDASGKEGQQEMGAEVSFQLKEVIATGHRRTVRQVAYSPSGRTIATASFDATVGIWEQAPDQDLIEDGDSPDFTSHSRSNGTGNAASGGGGDGQPEWDCIGTLEGHDSECKSVAFSRDGTLLASCSRDKSVWIWEVHPDSELECLSVLMEHTQDVKSVAWHPKEELLASASYDDTVKLYIDDPSDEWYCYQTLTGHTSTVWSLSFSPCGNFLATSSDDLSVRIWRKLTAEQAEYQGLKVLGEQPGRKGDHWACTNIIKGYHTRTIYSVSWGSSRSSNKGSLGRIATGGGDGNIFVFDIIESEDTQKSLVPTATLIASISQAHGVADVNCVAWAPRSIAQDDLTLFPDSLASAATSNSNGMSTDGAATARFQEIQEDESDNKGENEDVRNRRAGGHPYMCDLLASAGDDGVIKVWTLDGSPLAPQSI